MTLFDNMTLKVSKIIKKYTAKHCYIMVIILHGVSGFWISFKLSPFSITLRMLFWVAANLEPSVFRLFGQRLVARRDSGDIKFYYRRISVVKQWKPLWISQSFNLNFFYVSRVSPGAHPLTKKPEDSGYEIG